MEIYLEALMLDVPVVLICALLLLRFGDVSFSHPATPYFVFHIFVVTLRLVALVGGSPTLFTNWIGYYDPVIPEEISRAAMYCDVALATMTFVWLCIRRPKQVVPDSHAEPLNTRIALAIVVISFILGMASLSVTAVVPGMETNTRAAVLGDWGTSSYVAVAQTWPGLALLAYIYCFGFKRVPSILLAVYFLLIAYQGFHRFRIVIPLLLLVQIWLDRQGRRWPPVWMSMGLLAAALAFFPLKKAANMAREGASVSLISEAVGDTFTELGSGEAHDQKFLDELACSLTLLDIQGKWYWGSSYLALLTLPIPRQIWPDKPMLFQNVREISLPTRPMADNGMTSTYIGEAYANMGFPGVLLLPPLLAAGLALFRRRAYRAGYGTVIRLTYVLLAANLIQVYRDGFGSLFVFTFVNMLPLMALISIQVAITVIRKNRSRALTPSLPLAAPGLYRPRSNT